VSHLKEREEKNCLNCQATVQGRYCQECGQENIEPKESFWQLVTHFTYDITHFDGKFFSTLKYLLFKPGFLSHEYLRGRRASYLHPIRMYVFTSAFFFLIFFSTRSEDDGVMKMNTIADDPAAEIMESLEKRKKRTIASLDDSISATRKVQLQNLITTIDSDLAMMRKDTMAKHNLRSRSNEYNFLGGTQGAKFKTLRAYDSAQASLPKDQRDNFLERRFVRQNISLKEKYNNNSTLIWKAVINKFNRLFPQMLFVSLPLFAMILKLLYVRRKKFYYVNHIIFAIHLYCGTFILILAGMALSGIFKLFHIDIRDWVMFIFILAGFFYWYKSMRKFYEQRRAKTMLKYFLMLFMSLIMMSLIFSVFFVFSALSV
jgi:hypothetical protein